MGNENQPGPEEIYDIRIARDGTWWHNGGRIDRIGLVKLFASILKRDENGQFWLVTPAEHGRITVEDAPFIAVELKRQGDGKNQALSFRTNLDEWVVAGKDHPLSFTSDADGQTKPYIEVRNGLEARLNRAVYYELMELATGEHGVWSGGQFFEIPQ